MANKNKTASMISHGAPFLIAVLFFFVVCLSAASTVKLTAVFCIILALGSCVFRFSRLSERFTLPMIVLTLFMLMGGISTFYAISGKFALQEFLKLLLSFCLSLFLLVSDPGKGVSAGRRIASTIASSTAFAGLVSIDLISTRLLSSAVLWLLDLPGDDYAVAMDGVEAGVRMLSIFRTPNAFAGLIGIGVLLSLSLVLSSEKPRERCFHLVCLFVNALAFLLAFSMGASIFIAAAFLVYLLLEFKERRAGLFALMLQTLVLTFLSTLLISLTAFDVWDGIQPIPMLCVVVGSAAMCVVDKYVMQPVGQKLSAHGKLLSGLIGGILAALAAYAVLGYNLTGGIDWHSGEGLRRSIYPAPGVYTVAADFEGSAGVVVESQNRQDTMTHTSTTLYSGALLGATFTVPEDSMVVYLTFYTEDGTHIESVRCEGPESISVPLQYKLLPGFIANRLQGLWANQNAIQRTVFFEDGMKLFTLSPIVGLGLGAYENGILNVQSFFYETKYAHNHYIQVLAELGIIGFILFIAVLGVFAAAVVMDRKRTGTHPMTPALGAAMVFVIGHITMEVCFSFYAYLPVVFGLFALIALCCGDAIPMPALKRKVRSYPVIACGALTALFTVFLVSNMSAASSVKTAPSMQTLVTAAKADPFERADYMLSYVVNSYDYLEEYPEVREQAEEFADKLSTMNSNTIPYYLAQYYFRTGNTERAMEMVLKYLNYVTSDQRAWDKAFQLLRVNMNGEVSFTLGMHEIRTLLETWNAENIGTITLSDADMNLLITFTE